MRACPRAANAASLMSPRVPDVIATVIYSLLGSRGERRSRVFPSAPTRFANVLGARSLSPVGSVRGRVRRPRCRCVSAQRKHATVLLAGCSVWRSPKRLPSGGHGVGCGRVLLRDRVAPARCATPPKLSCLRRRRRFVPPQSSRWINLLSILPSALEVSVLHELPVSCRDLTLSEP
jgi:hypothetical protein